jgi:hypothetical protein
VVSSYLNGLIPQIASGKEARILEDRFEDPFERLAFFSKCMRFKKKPTKITLLDVDGA